MCMLIVYPLRISTFLGIPSFDNVSIPVSRSVTQLALDGETKVPKEVMTKAVVAINVSFFHLIPVMCEALAS